MSACATLTAVRRTRRTKHTRTRTLLYWNPQQREPKNENKIEKKTTDAEQSRVSE